MFVGAAGILFAGLFVSVDAFRGNVMNFVYSRQQTHTDIVRYDENDNRAEKPEEWPNDYYPTWIPEGFALEQVRVTEDFAILISGDLPENELLRCAGSIPLKK